MIGLLKRQQTSPKSTLIASLEGHFESLLRTIDQIPSPNGTGRSVGITSCLTKQGVSSIAINLAATAAKRADRSVLLVDTNLDGSKLCGRFQVKEQPGLAQIVLNQNSIDEVLQATEFEKLQVLSSGGALIRQAVPELVHRMPSIIAGLKTRFETIIFDLPVADRLSPCFVFAGLLDGILLTVEQDSVYRDQAVMVKQQLESSGAKLLGVVVNKMR